jgi:hypothetical protein
MKNLRVILSIAILSLIACQKEAGLGGPDQLDRPHALVVYLTDHETPVFDKVFIDIRKLEVKIEDDTLPGDGWITLAINPGIYDILRFRNGLDTLFATGSLPNARLKKIRLTLGTQNTAENNGQVFPLNIDDSDREIVADLEVNNFEISNGQVFFWIDFDAGNSIQVDNSGSGNNNGYRLRAHIKIFSQSHTGRIEGKVLPLAADPIVMAINGTDTATAIPDASDGEFKIVGLTPGTYKLFVDGSNNYQDSTLNNILVKSGEDTHVPTIFLHQ